MYVCRFEIMPKLEQFEIKKYWQIFSGLGAKDNKVTHSQVLPILHNSKLDSSVLNKIWFLADIDEDDNLDFEEFVICMRLIFDMVNKIIDSVPDKLPSWLIPGSKADLVRRNSSMMSNTADYGSSDLCGEGGNCGEMEWYISPSDRSVYEYMYENCSSSVEGGVSFSSLYSLVLREFKSVDKSDFDKAWRLVNPKDVPTIDKDAMVYCLHILKQKNDQGVPIPTSVSPALKNVFSKAQVSTDLNVNVKGDIRTDSRPVGNESPSVMNGVNVSERKDFDCDVLVLQKELAELDKELSELYEKKASITHSKTLKLRSQFEALLKYKKDQSSESPTTSTINVLQLTGDIESLESEVQILEQYLSNKKTELQRLTQELRALE